MTFSHPRTSLLTLILLASGPATLRAEGELPVAELKRDTPVDFATEVVPFLRKNCFACHNEKKSKAGLNLESPQAMLTGGDSRGSSGRSAAGSCCCD